MDLRIGVSQTAKEIEVELPADADADVIKADLAAALADDTTFWVTDKKGRQIGVPGAKIAYVELGSPDDGRRIGFGG